MWKKTSSVDDVDIYGIEFTYSNDCCGQPDIVHMYGSQTGSNVFSLSISSKVTAVSFRYDSSKLSDIWFSISGGAGLVKTCGCTIC